MKHSILLGLLMAITLSLYSQTTKTALFIGNSYTSRDAPGQNLFDTLNIPKMTSKIAESFNDSLYYETKVNPGKTFEWQIAGPGRNQTLNKINSRPWDYVALQEQSLNPIFAPSNTFTYGAELVNAIKANHECSEPIFYMTWGREKGFSGLSYTQMQDILKENYLQLTYDNDATVAPVGEALRELINQFPNNNFFANDGSHPTPTGKYLAACVFYASIFNSSPINSSYIPSLVDSVEAINIQNIAHQIVFHNVSLWRIGHQDSILAEFNYSGNNPFEFTNASINADSCIWNFGDGNSSTDKNPSHSYSANDIYDVELSVFNQCTEEWDTKTIQIDLLTTSINESNKVEFTLYPNPAIGQTLYLNKYIDAEVVISNMAGQVILNTIVKTNNEIDIAQLNPGIYFVSLMKNNQAIANQKIVLTK